MDINQSDEFVLCSDYAPTWFFEAIEDGRIYMSDDKFIPSPVCFYKISGMDKSVPIYSGDVVRIDQYGDIFVIHKE